MQQKLDQLEYKFGFDWNRKTFPNCLAKAPLNDTEYLVLDYYKPRKKGLVPGWYVAVRGYDSPRPKRYVRLVQESMRTPITFKQAQQVLLAEQN